MSDDPILYERRGAVAIITFNRPKVLNALDLPTLDALEAVVNRAVADAEVRVLLFAGGERAFVAGGDIGDLNSRRGLPHYQEFAERIHAVMRRIETIDKPTIAAVRGWCLGGGAELLLCTDIRIVGQSAKIGLPEINLGLFPGAGGSQRIIRQLPLCIAKELMFSGAPVDAARAAELGLVNRVVADDALLDEAMATAETIASKSPLVLKLLKRSLLDGGEMPLGASLRYEQAMIGLVLDSDDAHEGCTAFLEKRAPNFTGR